MKLTSLTTHRPLAVLTQGSRSTELLGGWMLLLIALGLLRIVRDRFEAWLWMWFVGFTIFFGFKFLTLLNLDKTWRLKFTTSKLAAYLFFWPGLDPRVFVNPVTEKRQASGYLWVNGLLQMLFGTVAIWAVPWGLPSNSPRGLRAWAGMIGFSLFVHFGMFDLLAAIWRIRGIPVEKLFSNPWRSVSLSDFWSNRWNRSFSQFSGSLVFRPLARRWGIRWASLAVFIFSGFLHEMMISVPARGGYGGPLAYFILNGLGICIETRSDWRKLTRRWPVLGRVWAMALVLVPLPLLFHYPFQDQVVIPFLGALRATANTVNS